MECGSGARLRSLFGGKNISDKDDQFGAQDSLELVCDDETQTITKSFKDSL